MCLSVPRKSLSTDTITSAFDKSGIISALIPNTAEFAMGALEIMEGIVTIETPGITAVN